MLHRHHSSVSRRLDQLGPLPSLGIELTEPAGLLRASIALAVWWLLDD
ncbi:hypothetical protein [Actinoalloteichus hymeniacidonis]|nr:hypothetical protein [Actinoalloteichus hymeniacidonis]MBB5907423.1 hypothetical protein [Actinoalloteichus hymeniacidonis]